MAARAHCCGSGCPDPGPAWRAHAGRPGAASRPGRLGRHPSTVTDDIGAAGLRREAPRDLSDVGDDEALLDRIRDEIRATGPMTFARFMELALYGEGGYYRAAAARPGRDGDFLTAPELHPIFGRTLAQAIEEIWRRLGEPAPF